MFIVLHITESSLSSSSDEEEDGNDYEFEYNENVNQNEEGDEETFDNNIIKTEETENNTEDSLDDDKLWITFMERYYAGHTVAHIDDNDDQDEDDDKNFEIAYSSSGTFYTPL